MRTVTKEDIFKRAEELTKWNGDPTLFEMWVEFATRESEEGKTENWSFLKTDEEKKYDQAVQDYYYLTGKVYWTQADRELFNQCSSVLNGKK